MKTLILYGVAQDHAKFDRSLPFAGGGEILEPGTSVLESDPSPLTPCAALSAFW